MSREEYFGDWSKIIDLDFVDKIIKVLPAYKEPVCPLPKDLFRAFNLCPLKQTRVIILGQDPYNNFLKGKPIATGLAFANPKDTDESNISPSLNVIMESIIDFTIPHEHINFDISLEKWEAQGVLLLNSALSCFKDKPGSHTLMWRPFISNLLQKVSWQMSGIVYVLLGSAAQSFKNFIKKDSIIIECRHPAYYARTREKMPNIWKDINDILIGQNGYGIEWYNNN